MGRGSKFCNLTGHVLSKAAGQCCHIYSERQSGMQGLFWSGKLQVASFLCILRWHSETQTPSSTKLHVVKISSDPKFKPLLFSMSWCLPFWHFLPSDGKHLLSVGFYTIWASLWDFSSLYFHLLWNRSWSNSQKPIILALPFHIQHSPGPKPTITVNATAFLKRYCCNLEG